MRILLVLFSLMLLISPFKLLAKYHYAETASINLPTQLSKWKLAFQKSKEDGDTVTRYLPESETMKDWTQLINIQFKDRKHIPNLDAVGVMKQEAALNQGVTYKIHQKNSNNDILFEKIFPTGEHEVVRMIVTEKGLHRIGYAKRGYFSEADRAEWVERLAQSKISGKTTS